MRGSVWAARRAGRRQAVRPADTTIATTAANVVGSVAETPGIWLERKRVSAKFIQELKKLLGKYLSTQGRKVLATNTTAPVSTGNHDCLKIKSKRRFSVEQDFLLAHVEFVFHAANSIVV